MIPAYAFLVNGNQLQFVFNSGAADGVMLTPFPLTITPWSIDFNWDAPETDEESIVVDLSSKDMALTSLKEVTRSHHENENARVSFDQLGGLSQQQEEEKAPRKIERLERGCAPQQLDANPLW